jgi:hypothetical protein
LSFPYLGLNFEQDHKTPQRTPCRSIREILKR